MTKEERKEYNKAHYLKNKEKVKERTKQYRLANKDKSKQWYLDNKIWWEGVLSGAYRLERIGDQV